MSGLLTVCILCWEGQVTLKYSLADVNAEVSSDGSGLGMSGVGLTQHHPARHHHTFALPHLEYMRGMRPAAVSSSPVASQSTFL